MQAVQQQFIDTRNGYSISATLFNPPGCTVSGKVLIVPAMGVRQAYYANFASWLAEQGYLVLTFDYSGTGDSKVQNIRDMGIDLIDWGQFDAAAALQSLASIHPDKPVYWIGHSLGGQLLGLSSQSHMVSKAITIASGGGYWLESPLALKLRVWWLWYFVAPLATRIFGYFPGRKLRKVGDIPKGVMQQWRRWCLTPGYAIAAEGSRVKDMFDSVRTPITSLHASDDEIVSPINVSTLLAMYANATTKAVEITPESVSRERIGHFGFFNSRFKESLWEPFILPELAPSTL